MRLLIVGTLKGQLTTATKIAMENGASVTHAEATEQAMAVLRGGKGADLLLVDVGLDIRDLVMRLEAEHIHVPIVACGISNDARAAVAAIHAGAKEYIPLPPDPELIAAVLAAVANDSRDLVYRDEAMGKVVKLAQQIAGSDASVMITGESGTGKEVLARYVHSRSTRAKRPFISINCAAIPEHLLESELFGHEKGAFTGAIARRIGKFEEATGGTLLLDEISEMDVRLQSKLLRAIQERVIDRVGGTKPVAVNIRIIATSNRNLAEAVRSGTFREDLLFRLNVVNLKIPSLRDRPADILELAQHFARKYADANGVPLRPISPEARRVLTSNRWQGKHHPSRGADGAGRRDRRRRDPDAGWRPARPRQDRACRGARYLCRRTGHPRPGRAHRRRCRARPDPGNAEALPRQPHPRRQHPRHLDPHAAQQAQRIRRRRPADHARRRRRLSAGCGDGLTKAPHGAPSS
jgi:two-component system response regulator FlrC